MTHCWGPYHDALGIMLRKEKWEIITQHLYGHLGVNATYALIGSKSKPTQRILDI